ncbi:MAG: hypothetical protein KGK09_13350 [Burkholderiales bacterium]|nr:hypothetical protein [Burkholderiales bacterium]
MSPSILHPIFGQRRLLRGIGRVLVGFLLLTQLALSGYACPARGPAAAPAADAAAQPAAMPMATAAPGPHEPGCDGMSAQPDARYANLCAAHCQQGQQSDHAPAAPVLAAALPTVLYLSPPRPGPALAPARAAAATAAGALAAASPPLAILHCCWRN